MIYTFLKIPVVVNIIAIFTTKIFAGPSAAFYISNVYDIISIVTTNIKLFILLYLSFIFIKALYLNFITKHDGESNSLKLLYKLRYIIINVINIILNVKNLNKANVYLILKIFILLIFLRLTLRSFIYLLLNNENTTLNNIISVLLSLTFILYFSNLIIKYIKKDKFTSSDYYLYNSYVIKNVNIYNILYIISINYIITNYSKLLITIMIIILISIPVIFIFKYISRYDTMVQYPKFTQTNLESAAPSIPFLMYIGVILKEVIEKEYVNFVPGNITPLKKIIGTPHEENGVIKCYSETFAQKDLPSRASLTENEEHLLKKIEKNPIVKLAYEQIKAISKLTHYLYISLKIKGLFIKDDLNVCILESSKNQLLVTLSFKGKNMYMPNFYLGYNVDESLKILGKNLNVDLIKLYGRAPTMVIMTPAEMYGENTLKIFRPDVYYSDLNMYESNMWKYLDIVQQNNTYYSNVLGIECEAIKVNYLRNNEAEFTNLGNIIEYEHNKKVQWDNCGVIWHNLNTFPCVFPRKVGYMEYIDREFDTVSSGGIILYSGKKFWLNKKVWELDLFKEHLNLNGKFLFEKPFNTFNDSKEFLNESRKSLVNRVKNHIINNTISRESFGILIEGLNYEFYCFDSNPKLNYSSDGGPNKDIKYNMFSLIDLDAGKKSFSAEWNARGKQRNVIFSLYDTASYKYGEDSVQRMRNKISLFIKNKN